MPNVTPHPTSRNKEYLASDQPTQDDQDVNRDKIGNIKDEFISIVSHELRTPMSTIKGYLNMLLAGDAGPIAPRVKEVLTEMLLAIEREIRLVNGMLEISRFESGRMPFTLRNNVDVVEQARLLLHSLKGAAAEKNLSLVLETPKEVLPKIQADTDKLIQVLINLVSNAMKFTEKGSVTVNFAKEGDFVITCVADTGAGIPVEKRSHLFEKFSQASTRETRVSGGSGLGLYISKNIIERLGGKLWLAESKPKVGSKFCFYLPISGSDKAKEVAQTLKEEKDANE